MNDFRWPFPVLTLALEQATDTGMPRANILRGEGGVVRQS